MLNDEQAQKIKTHLMEQLENFPEEQRKIIKHKLLSMNNSELEEFIKENQIAGSTENKEVQKCIFCSIIKKEIKSYILEEDKDYLAILELNPLSKGHVLIIPKEHLPVDKIPENSIEFAKKVSSNIFKKLKPKDVQFQKNEVLGHGNLEAIPIYDEEKLERKRATDEELSELAILLGPEKLEKIGQKEELPLEKSTYILPEEEEKVELPKIKPRLKWI